MPRALVTPNDGAAEEPAATLHVSSSAAAGPASASDGSAASPYRSLQAAKDHIIRQHTRDGASSIRHIQIHPKRNMGMKPS